MIAKVWKKVIFAILIVACLFNIVSKFVMRMAVVDELRASAQYQYEQEQKNNEKTVDLL